MIVKKRFAPSFLISCNLVQFRGFSGLHFFGRSRFLPSLSRVARLHKKDRHLFEDASFQNGCGAKSVFASIYFVCFFLGFVIRGAHACRQYATKTVCCALTLLAGKSWACEPQSHNEF